VLVHAAASGVGTAMIQLIKAAGAKSIAVSSSDSKLQICKDLGADYVINYKTHPDFQHQVMQITQNRGADVIADPVGASNAMRNVASLAVDGKWVLYGSLGGRIIENFDLGALVAKRGILFTTTLKTRSVEYKTELIQKLAKHFFHSGHGFKPVIEKVLPMSDAKQAHELMESNATIGKILLKYDL